MYTRLAYTSAADRQRANERDLYWGSANRRYTGIILQTAEDTPIDIQHTYEETGRCNGRARRRTGNGTVW